MAAPNVTVKLVDESFVVRGFEDISTTVGAAFADGQTWNIFTAFATSTEYSNGFITLNNVGEWVDRYNTKFTAYQGKTLSGAVGDPYLFIPFGFTGSTLSVIKSPDPTFKGLTSAGQGTTGPFSTFYNGLTGDNAEQWWAVANFLQYGGSIRLSGLWGATYTSLQNPVMDKSKVTDLDVVFTLQNTVNQAAAVNALVGGRDYDCVGIVGASGSFVGYAGVSGVDGVCYQSGTIETRQSGLGKYGICVYGTKTHLGLDLNDDESLITSSLVPDYAGVICRTDRDYAPWYPPAGLNRGRIISFINLNAPPSPANQDYLYDKGINFAVTLPGEGSFFFGDRTMESNTSTFSRINVSRLFIFLIKTIGPLAKRFLFELNDNVTRQLFVNAVTPVLQRVQADRGITEYVVICDATNNPPSVVDANEFVADIQVKPAKSINYITIRFTNKNT